MIHEDLLRNEEVQGSSDRTFALFFAGVFLLLGLEPLRRDQPVRTWLIALAAIFLIVGFLRPSLIRSLNRAWMSLGLILARMFNPVIMGVLFFLVVTPMAVVMRVAGRDALRRRPVIGSKTYWIIRKDSVQTGGMRRQF